jgi:hypothetical protein
MCKIEGPCAESGGGGSRGVARPRPVPSHRYLAVSTPGVRRLTDTVVDKHGRGSLLKDVGRT